MTGKKAVAVILGVLILAASFFGTARLGKDQILPAFCQTEIKNGEKQMKKVALTFDDGPDPEYTQELLDGLKARDVRATFFVLGKQAKSRSQKRGI